MTTAVQDRLTLDLTLLKQYLRVDDDTDDAIILALGDAAKASADAYLNNPFLDGDGEALAIPADVRVWVWRRVMMLYESRIEGARSDDVAGLGSVDYGVRDEGGSRDIMMLKPYRLNPGL